MNYHIIYLEEKMLLSKRNFKDWKHIQNQFESYKASLGPWDEEGINTYFKEEHPDLLLKNKSKLESFFRNNKQELELTD